MSDLSAAVQQRKPIVPKKCNRWVSLPLNPSYALQGEQPVDVAVWALVDDIVAIDAGDKRLTAVDWKSGTNMRIIDVVAPFCGEAEMLEQIAALGS